MSQLGAGAKTAAGNGYLLRNYRNEKNALQALKIQIETQQKDLQKATKMSQLTSDLEKAVYLSLFEPTQTEEAEKQANEWLNKMKADEKPTDVKIIARQLKAFYQSIGKWENPSKTRQKPKVDRIKTILGE